MAQDGSKHSIWVLRIDGDVADLPSVLEARVEPSFASIHGFIHAISHTKVWPLQALARSNIKDIWVGLRHG